MTIIFIFFTVLGFSQDSEIYKAVFENNENFRFLDFYDKQNRKKITHYNILDIPYGIHPKTFKYDYNIYYSKSLVDSLIYLSNGDYHSEVRINNAKKSSELFTFDEQDYLYNAALKSKITRIYIKSSKVKMISEVGNENLYFRVSNIVYSKDKQKAYLKVEACNDNDLFGYSFFIFALKNDEWVQIYEDEKIFL